ASMRPSRRGGVVEQRHLAPFGRHTLSGDAIGPAFAGGVRPGRHKSAPDVAHPISVERDPEEPAEDRGGKATDVSDENSPEDDFQEMLRRMLGGDMTGAGGIDPEQLKGLGIDPAQMRQMMFAFQQAMSDQSGDGISWDAARTGALHVANQDARSIGTGQRTDLARAFQLADLWLRSEEHTS